MTSPVGAHPTDFERFVVEYHPDIFIDWELEASHLLELDEWAEREHHEILEEYHELLG